MSQLVVNCAKCGKPKAPPVVTQQSAREADWPTRVKDALSVLQQFRGHVAKGEVTVNGRRLGVPDPPSWVPPKEAA